MAKTSSKKKDKDILKELKKKRDSAIEWREKTGWNGRLDRSVNYYQYGIAQDILDLPGDKQRQRKANYVFSNIEAIIPKMFDRLPSFQVLGRGKEDFEKAPKAEEILRYKLEQHNIETLLEDVVRDSLVKSQGYLKITWELKTTDDQIEEDDIDLSIKQPKNIWITAGDVRLEEAEGVFEKMFISPAVVKSKFGKDLEADSFLMDDKEKKEGRVVVWEYHGILNGDKKVWTFTEKDILDSRDWYEHGMIPYIEFPNYRRSDEFYPWSEVFQIEPLQDELIEIDNQASEFRKRCINPKKIVKKGAVDEVNMNRLKDPRINVVEAIDPAGIQWEQAALIGQDIYNFRNIKKEDIGLMTGQNELSRGGTERTVKTATGQQILFDAAQGRVRQKVRVMERGLKNILKQMQGLLAEFQDKEEQIRITDEEGNPFSGYTKEDIQGNFDFIIDIVETMPVLREKRGQLALQAYELLREDPDIDQRALKKMVLKKAFQDINAEALLKNEEVEEPEMDIDQLGLPPQIPQTQIPQIPQQIQQPMGQQLAPTGAF